MIDTHASVWLSDAIWCHKTLLTSVKLQNMSWYKTGFVSRQILHLLSKLQNWICLKTGQYKTYIVSNTKIEASIRATKPKSWQSHLTSETVEIFIQNEKAGLVSTHGWYAYHIKTVQWNTNIKVQND